MIVISEKNEEQKINTIHLIMGEESDFQLDMTGQIVIDISKAIDPKYKNFILINRCDDETELQNKMGYYHQRAQQEQIRDKVQTEIAKMFAQMTGQEVEEDKPSAKSQTSNTSKTKQKTQIKKDLSFDPNASCPKCGSKGTVIFKGKVDVCATCREIDEGLRKNEIPPYPSVDDQIKMLHALTSDDDEFRQETSEHLNRRLKSKQDEENG